MTETKPVYRTKWQRLTDPEPDSLTLAEIEEGVELLGGYEPVVAYEPSADVLYRDPAGNMAIGRSPQWIKLGVSFRTYLKQLKGAPLAVYLCICLHVNTHGESWPSYTVLCKETGYSRTSVARAIRKLAGVPGLMQMTRRRNKSTLYKPGLAAYGKGKLG